jgi:hypothetical protein
MHLNQQRPVTLHNSYQGVPVSTEAEVAMVHQDFVGLIVHPYQAVCIKDARYTFIESKMLPEMIRAYPASIDYTNQVVLLKQLNVAHAITIDLLHSWVAPEKPIDVEIQSKNGDISTATLLGIAVLEDNRVRVVMAVPEGGPFLRGDKLSLGFKLDPLGEPLSVQGKVQSLIKIRNRDEKRLEVDGRAVMTDEVSILAYIAQREDQIMQGLDKMYKKLRRGKKAGRR